MHSSCLRGGGRSGRSPPCSASPHQMLPCCCLLLRRPAHDRPLPPVPAQCRMGVALFCGSVHASRGALRGMRACVVRTAPHAGH